MKRGEKPEGYRQMRPNTFPASGGNSQQMLQEIRESLRNLSRSADVPRADVSIGKGPPDDPRQQGRSNNPRNPQHHRALQEIRESLIPFANKASSSGNNADINRHMLQKLQDAGFDQEMVVHALKQTNSHSVEAAIEYISRMNFQEPAREQITARPVNTAIKHPGPSQIPPTVLRRKSWKGSKESLAPQRHSALMNDVMIYRPSSPGPQSDLSRPATFPQNLAAGASGQRVNPPLPRQVRSITPPPTSWDSNPSTKRYPGNSDYMVPQLSPVPQGPRPDGYINPPSQAQRVISPVPVGRQPIIMQNPGGNKFTFPPSWPQNGNIQSEYVGINSSGRQPLPPPYPMHPTSRQSPTAQQMQSSALAITSNGSNRNSHNLDMYNLGVLSQVRPSVQQPQTSPGHSTNQDVPLSWPHSIPGRSNSFTNAQPSGRQCPSVPNSQPSGTTVTTITQAPILQPVKSIRVQKPELHTAVAPTHPPYFQQPPLPSSAYQEPSAPMAAPEVPSYQGPPPPYPTHRLQQLPQPGYDPNPGPKPSNKEEDGVDNDTDSTCSSERTEGSEEREKKQITTSPVPVRRWKRDEERKGDSRVPMYSPQAFKFFMEQHVENILKNHQQRIRRKKQLESEMQRSRCLRRALHIGCFMFCD
ncbi:serine/threonine-protein kinase LATS1 isoform X3 [Carassius gibelio]|uniref:serine/threonine-protein kinase LATS1 isoform X3 n=1 Tax=Carassius gibelio TaxID=101364 RepID=UPI0022784A08|nr:serine/threonine-protein kinase LATS1 isoform X3 [Carassius gibelio]